MFFFSKRWAHQAGQVLEHIAHQYLVQIQLGYFVKAAVAFGKFKQALAAAFNGINAQFNIFQVGIAYAARLSRALQAVFQGISQRRNRGNRVHDLMRHHIQQFRPCL
jgi:hypothetical protein